MKTRYVYCAVVGGVLLVTAGIVREAADVPNITAPGIRAEDAEHIALADELTKGTFGSQQTGSVEITPGTGSLTINAPVV